MAAISIAQTEDTIYIFPSGITATGDWKNVQSLGTQDLSENARFSDFSDANSAFIQFSAEERREEFLSETENTVTRMVNEKDNLLYEEPAAFRTFRALDFIRLPNPLTLHARAHAESIDGIFHATSSETEEQEQDSGIAQSETEMEIIETTILDNFGAGNNENEQQGSPESVGDDALPDEEFSEIIVESVLQDEQEHLHETSARLCDVTNVPCNIISLGNFSVGGRDKTLSRVRLRMSLGAQSQGESFLDDKMYVRYQHRGVWYLAGEIVVAGVIDNISNRGHLLFELPEVVSWSDLDEITVELEYARNGTAKTELYLDGVWLEVTSLSSIGGAHMGDLPENVTRTLNAFDDSLSPDVLYVGSKRIEFSYTDENENENLIIKTDKEFYEGLTRTKVYFNVTNESGREDEIHIQAFFPKHGEVTALRKWTKNVPVEVVDTKYTTMAYFCEAGWVPIIIDPSGEEEQGTEEVFEDLNGAEEVIVDIDEEIGRGGTMEEGSILLPMDEALDTASAQETLLVEDAYAGAFIAGEAGTDVEMAEENAAEQSSEIEDVFLHEEENVAPDFSEETQSVTEEAQRTEFESVSKKTTTSTEHGLALCRALEQVRSCTSFNEDKTNCIIDNERIEGDTVVEYRDMWRPVSFTDDEVVVDYAFFTRLSRLLGVHTPRKETPPSFSVKAGTNETHLILPGQTLYFEMEITFPSNSRGEFYLETIGKRGGYGHLDPWWNGSWQYRLPITIDNTGNSSILEEYQIYVELDSSETVFWDNVKNDGSDIRFLRQVDGITNDWYDPNWAYRIPITIQSSQIDATLTDFPVHVDLADLGSHFFANVQSDGDDIRITGDTGSSSDEVAIEVVAINTASSTGELYFRAPSLSATQDTTFYIYYGNSSASGYAVTDTYGARAVWDSNYVLVTHMNDLTTSSVRNSKSGSFDGTKASSNNPLEVDGRIGKGQDFSNDHISHGNLGIGSTYTAEAWVKADNTGGTGDSSTYGWTIFASAASGAGYPLWLTFRQNEIRVWAYEGGATGYTQTSGAGIATGTWYHVALTAISGSTTRLYLNGSQILTYTNDGEVGWTNIFTQGDLRPSRAIYWDGIIDATRISSAIRSPEWISASYRNMATTTQFYATSTHEVNIPFAEHELDHWVQYFVKDEDAPSRNYAAIWVKVDEIAASASTTIHLYFGNQSAGSESDPYAPFTYNEPRPLYYVVRDNYITGSSIEVYSLIDNNVVQLNNGATTSLNLGEGVSYSTFTATSVVSALGPVMAKLERGSGTVDFNSLVPIAFAGTQFLAINSNGATERFHVYAPFGSSTVSIFNGNSATPGTVIVVATSSANASDATIGNGNAGVVEALVPVLLSADRSVNDSQNPYPATLRDLYGVRSQNSYMSSMQASTNFRVDCSIDAGATTTGEARGNRLANAACGNGANGTGQAIRISNQNNSMAAVQQADGDRTAATVFLPAMEFGTRYVLPVNTSYIAVVCPPENGITNLSIKTATGTEVSTASCTSASNVKPGKAYFGDDDTINYFPGYYIESTDDPPKPFYAYYEDHNDAASGSNGGHEQNFLGGPQARQLAYPHPSHTIGSVEESDLTSYRQYDYRWYANTDALTPTDSWPEGGDDLGENTPIGGSEAVGANAVVRLRTSLLVQNATTTADTDSFRLAWAQIPIGGSCDASGLSWQAVAPIGSTTASWRGFNNGSVSDGISVGTTTLQNTTHSGSYEEENNSAFVTGGLAPGSIVEFDWVVQNNAAAVNAGYCFRMEGVGKTGVVGYNSYPLVETNSAPGIPSLVSPFDNAKASSTAPALRFFSVDAAGDDIHYQVQVATSTTFGATIVDASSIATPLLFDNIIVPADKAPFNSGNTIQYVIQTALSNGVTYYWRVRARDPNGANVWGEWSAPNSFTIDTSLEVSTWFQTMQEQFETGGLRGVMSTTLNDVRLGGAIGEYGSTTVTDESWKKVSLSRRYINPVIVASPRYPGRNVVQRAVRIRNKTETSFEIKASGSDATAAILGNTVMDYFVLEAGEHYLDDGTVSGRLFFAGSRIVEGIYCSPTNTSGAGTIVVFPTTFSAEPAVLHTVTSDNDNSWVTSSVDSGTALAADPATNRARFWLQRSHESCTHEPEAIDFIAVEQGHGTLVSGEFDAVRSATNSVSGANNNATGYGLNWSSSFATTPQTYVGSMSGIRRAGGGFAITDTRTAVSTTQYRTSIDEDGPGADRTHATERVAAIGFAASSGTTTALGVGTLIGKAVDFNDGNVGNTWGSASWNDNQASGTINYFLEYKNGDAWSKIPDSDLPGNEVGTTTGPIDLTSLDTTAYRYIRLIAEFAGTTATQTPVLYDWTITWNRGVFVPVLLAPFNFEKIGTTTPILTFTTSDPQGDDLIYHVQISTSSKFTEYVINRTSDIHTGFTNSTTPADTNPFNSGDTVQYAVQAGDGLLAGETYWWRVRARDPDGVNAWSSWSPAYSVTVDPPVDVSTWLQTTDAQFRQGTLNGMATENDALVIQSVVGEFGTVDVFDNNWVLVELAEAYNNLIVVGSARYIHEPLNDTNRQRDVRVRNKTNKSFEIKVDNRATTPGPFGTTTVDWIAMEAGSWTIDAGGGTPRKVIASSAKNVANVQNNAYSNAKGRKIVTFSPSFNAAPVVLATVSTENDSGWVTTHADDGTNILNAPTATQAGFALGRSHDTGVHEPEDIDYIAIDTGGGTTTDGVAFHAAIGGGIGCCSTAGYPLSFTPALPSAPNVAVVNQLGLNDTRGTWAHRHTGTAPTNTTLYVGLDRDNGTGIHTITASGVVGMWAFASTSGVIKRTTQNLVGTTTSPTIAFSSGTGPKWGSLIWSATTTSTSTARVRVLYNDGAAFVPVPDAALPGNAAGFAPSASPVSLGALPYTTYGELRLQVVFTCTASGQCPTLDAWEVTWSEGIVVSGIAREYDRVTDVATGTVRVAINGTLQGASGTIAGGLWSINNVNAFPNDIITVFIDGAAASARAVGVAINDGIADLTGMMLFERHLALGSNATTTITNADLASFDNSVAGDDDVFFEVNASNNLSVCAVSGCFGSNLYVATTTTYRPDSSAGRTITAHDVITTGHIIADANTFDVGGSWRNQGGFTRGTSHVRMTATSGMPVIDETGAATSSFHTLTFGVGSGTAVFSHATPLVVRGNLSINFGTLAPGARSVTLYGNLAVGAGGSFLKGTATTTFEGTSLSTWSDATSPKQDFGIVVASGTSKTVRLASPVKATNLIVTAGNTFDVSTSNHQLECAGSFTNNGTFTARNGTVLFSATSSGHVIAPGSSSFYDMTFNGIGGNWAFSQANATATRNVTIQNGTLTMPTGTFTVGGSFSNSGGVFMHNNGTLLMNSTASGRTLTASSSAFYNLTFSGTGGGWTMADGATTSNSFQITAGAVTLPSSRLTVLGDFNVTGGTFAHNNGEVKLWTLSAERILRTNGSALYNTRFIGPEGGSAEWYDTQWQYRIPLTIQSAYVSENLTHFPVYVDLSSLASTSLFSASANGGDIRVTESDGITEVPRELVSFATSTQTGELHFRATSVSSSSDTTFYLYYGNPSASDYATSSAYGAGSVWTNGYVAVFHLSTSTNSSASSSNGTFLGGLPQTTTGQLLDAQNFGGPSDTRRVEVPWSSSLNISGTITVEAWANLNALSSGDANIRVITNKQTSSSNRNWWLVHWNNFWQFRLSDGVVRTILSDNESNAGEWTHLAVTGDGSTLRMYVNGAVQSSTSAYGTINTQTQSMWIGAEGGSSRYFDGVIDEVRISNVARSAGWISAQYTNHSNGSSFFGTISEEEYALRMFTDTNTTVANNVVVESGNVRLPTGTLSIGGSYTNGGDVNANGGTVRFNANGTGRTVAAGNSSFHNVSFDSATGGWTVTEHATATAAWRILSAAGFTAQSGVRIAVLGVFENALHGTTTTWTGSTLSLLSTSTYTVGTKTLPLETYGTLAIGENAHIRMWNSEASGYDMSLNSSLYSQDHALTDGELYIFGNYTRGSGADHWSWGTDFDGASLSGNERQVRVRFADGASATFSGGTLNIQGTSSATTTIENQGSGTYVLTIAGGTLNAESFAFYDMATSGISILGTTTVTSLAPGYFELSVDGGTAITLASTTLNANPEYQLFRVGFATSSSVATGSNVTLSGTSSTFWWFREAYGNFAGEAYDSDPGGDPGNIRWDDSSYLISVSGTVYDGVGVTPSSICDGSTQHLRLIVGGTTYDTSCSATSSTFTFSSVAYVGDVNMVLFINDEPGARGAVLSRTPTGNVSGFDVYRNYTVVRHEDVQSFAISNIEYDSDFDSDIPFATSSGPTLLTDPGTGLLVWQGKTFAPGGTVTLHSGAGGEADGTLRLATSSALTLSGAPTLTIGGSWRAGGSSIFTPAQSTVLFSATSTGKIIQPQSMFNEVLIDGTGGGWSVESAMTVAQNLTVASGVLSGTQNITVQHGAVTGDGEIAMTGGTFTIERSGNFGGASNWSFHNLTLGDGTTASSTTKVGSGNISIAGALLIRANHTLLAGDDTWNFTGAGTVFTPTGTFLAQASTFVYRSPSALIIPATTYYNLRAEAPSSSPTYTYAAGNSTIEHAFVIGDGVNTVVVTADTNDPLVTVQGDMTISANATFVAASANDIRIAGSYTNNGTLTAPSGSTFVFNSDDVGETITTGGSAFANVRFNHASGGWTIIDSASSTGNWIIQNAASYTHASGTTLTVSGTFLNEVGGSATQWDDTTLVLLSTTEQTIHPKTVSDIYGTLSVGENGKVRTWNTSAAAYSVHPTAYLYSQDHGGIDGNLYIWGAYTQNSGTDHWSFDTDFDAAALTASTSRQVNVYIASSSAITRTGGALSIVGTSTATTTIQNQGAGTFSFTVSGGTFSLEHTRVRDTNAQGIVMTGTPTISQLRWGDFELAIDGGTMMTVGGMTITANPLKTFRFNNFATSSLVATGTNVTATGTAISSWRFTQATGNLAGEAYDSDPDGDPGYIVWDDSAADITISGNVYSDEGVTISSVCDGTTEVVRLLIQGADPRTTSCSSGDGSFSIPSVTFTAGDTLTLYLATTTTSAANVAMSPVTNINNMHLFERRVIVRHEDTDPITISALSVYDKDDDSRIPFTANTGAPHTLVLDAETKLIVWSGKTFAPGGNVTVSSGGSGNDYDGTLELQSGASFSANATETHSVGGSLLVGSGATFSAASSTMTFTATTTGKSITLNGSSLHHVLFNGAGGAWSMTDSRATTTGNFTITAGSTTLPSQSISIGGDFVNSGTFNAGTSTVYLRGNASTTVTQGNSAFHSLVMTGGGAYLFSGIAGTSTGNILLTAGSLSLPSERYTIGGSLSASAGSFVSSAHLRFISSEAGNTIAGGNNTLGALTFDGVGSWILSDTNATTTGSVTIANGSLTAPSGVLSIAGSFTNLASSTAFNANAGTLRFYATTTGHSITPAGALFSNVEFTGSGGGWSVNGSATSSGYWYLLAGASYTQATGTTLEVRGVFNNLMSGTSTDWTDSTLFLNGSSSLMSINTKTLGADAYATLRVGAQNHVRMWNSSAATTTVDTGGSLYSQDHSGIDGALYIWGTYTRSSGSDHWSFATDFDGASLLGNERVVSVNIASSSSLTYTGGLLSIVGSAGATTSIANQGVGRFSLAMSGGTLSAQHFAFAHIEASGLSLSGNVAVSQLSPGVFELADNGGTLITVQSGVINNNPIKVFSGNAFAFASGVSTGTNVTVSGTPASTWTFSNASGVLAGEAFDVDGSDACGAIRWDDSVCLEVSQAHYRFRADDGGEGGINAEWLDLDWESRKPITVFNDSASALSNYPLKIDIAYETEMQSNFADLRFTDASGTTTLPYYIERFTTSATATVWVKVPFLPANGVARLYVYYNNAAAGGAENMHDVFLYADDFEDNNISEYSGDTSYFSTSGSFAQQKSYGLMASISQKSGKTTDGIFRTASTTGRDTTLRFFQYVDATQDDEPCVLFAVQSPGTNNENYAVCLDQFPSDVVSISQNVSSHDDGGVIMATTAIAYTTGWYEVEVDWLASGLIDVSVYNSAGSEVASVSTTSNTYTSGGHGFSFWFMNGGWDFVSIRPYVAVTPTYRVGPAQSQGGASWLAPQNMPLSGQSAGEPFRLRISVENSGPAIFNQQFRLQYAPKGNALTCEAVSSVAYNDVPPAASCGANDICMTTSTHFADQDETGEHLLSSFAGAFIHGRLVESPSNQTGALDMATSTMLELEYIIEVTSNADEDAYCFRVTDGGLELDSYARVPELQLTFPPTIVSWRLNSDLNIALTEGTTTPIVATGTVSDNNGFADIAFATSTIYRSGTGMACSADDNNCYQLGTSSCPLSNCSGNTCDVVCTANMWFHADPTDIGVYAGEVWYATLSIEDQSGARATSTSLDVELLTLRALRIISGEINFGVLGVGEDTGATNTVSTLRNTGNALIDVDLAGDDLTAGSSTIPVGNIKYATSTFTYASCSICEFLSGTTTTYNLDLPKPTASTTPVTADIYWGIAVPSNTAGTTHYGVNYFIAVSGS